jgi:hypothetical protein
VIEKPNAQAALKHVFTGSHFTGAQKLVDGIEEA